MRPVKWHEHGYTLCAQRPSLSHILAMNLPLKHLLDRLDAIRLAHPEVRDADVRHALVAAVYHGFVLRVPGYSLPESLGMASAEGNAAVRIALAEFLDASSVSGARTPLQRFAAFQDATVESESGRCYSDYFGYQPSYEDLISAMSQPVARKASVPKVATAPWWQFWKRSQPRAS